VSYKIRFTQSARDDLLWPDDFLLKHDTKAANRVRETIRKGHLLLQGFDRASFPARIGDPVWRCGLCRYVALFEIEDGETMTILAVRYQREDDFH